MKSAAQPFNIIDANTFLSRAFGLLFRKPLDEGEALHLKPCNAIHTIGMRYAIDLVFLSGDFTIFSIRNHVGGFRLHRFPAAKSVLEMRAGEAHRLGLKPGIQLRWLKNSEQKSNKKSER